MTNKMAHQKTHKRAIPTRGSNVAPFPARPESVSDRREREGRCPECGAERACYSCLSQGGWISEAEMEENERAEAMSP